MVLLGSPHVGLMKMRNRTPIRNPSTLEVICQWGTQKNKIVKNESQRTNKQQVCNKVNQLHIVGTQGFSYKGKPKPKPSKIVVSLSNNNIFKSFFVNRLQILCYMFNSPLVVLLNLIIELSTRSTIEILNRTMILSKSIRR